VSSSKNILDIQNIDISCPVVRVFVCRRNCIFVPHKKIKRRTYLAEIKYVQRVGETGGAAECDWNAANEDS
jgi:hypothetical protein